MDKGSDVRQVNRFRKEPLKPEAYISPNDGLYMVFIKGRIALTDSIPIQTILKSTDDCMLIQKRYPVIRDYGRKQKGMCFAALRTFDAADPDVMDAIRQKDASSVIGMGRQAG